MSLCYCTYCDKHFDSNEQDHARYDYPLPIMCEDCVDLEKEREASKKNPDLSFGTRELFQRSWADLA